MAPDPPPPPNSHPPPPDSGGGSGGGANSSAAAAAAAATPRRVAPPPAMAPDPHPPPDSGGGGGGGGGGCISSAAAAAAATAAAADEPDAQHAVAVLPIQVCSLFLEHQSHPDPDALSRFAIPAAVHNVSLPATVLSALAHHVPHPFLRHNSVHPLFHALERVDVRFEAPLAVPAAWRHQPSAPLVLRLHGVLFAAHVSVNGRALRTVRNAFRPHLLPLPDLTQRSPAHALLCVRFASVHRQLQQAAPAHRYREWNDPTGGVSSVRLPQYLAGWDWAPRQLSQGLAHSAAVLRLRPPLVCDLACAVSLRLSPSLRARLSITAQLLVDHHCAPFSLRAVVLPRHLHARLCPRPHRPPPAPQLPPLYRRLLLGDRSVLASLRGEARLVQVVHLHPQPPPERPAHAPARPTAAQPPAAAAPPFMYNPFSELPLPRARTCRYAARFDVVEPRLWWPNGMGEQHLYVVHVAVFTHAPPRAPAAAQPAPAVLHESRSFRIGLRRLQLLREPLTVSARRGAPEGGAPEHGAPDQNPMLAAQARDARDAPDSPAHHQSLTFSVNGRAFFAKGANYIPSAVHFHLASDRQYERTISAACAANMNMLRVWGGGLYEKDLFYELCDERGLLLWHDFMFACSLYPGDERFLASCRAEAQYQVSRLRNHACMALWCGNNELEQVPHDILATEHTKRAYDTLFYHILPAVVQRDAGQTPYWPSSPHNPFGYEHGFNNPRAGDTHFWDVWHARKPLSSYLSHSSRFCSEFGMQSYLSEQGAVACVGDAPGALNPFGPTMEAHQKNASGNFIIMEYCQRLFRAPYNYWSLSYQSQLNQMICMRTGVEHFRRSWPYCAGALYWQLNDCWPCFSWSSLEYGGNWKALHYGAAKFFAPLLISAVHHGEETVGICNLISFTSDTGLFSVYGTFDGVDAQVALHLCWSLFDVRANETTKTVKEEHSLKQDTSRKLATVDVRQQVQSDPRNYVLRLVAKSKCRQYESSSTVWLCSPRLCELAPAKLTVAHEALHVHGGKSKAVLHIHCPTFAPFVQVELNHPSAGVDNGDDKHHETRYKTPVGYRLSDNYFDLFPGERKRVELTVYLETCDALVFPNLKVRSLLDSYMT